MSNKFHLISIGNSYRRQAGFSVIEVILAAAIFMILATGSITVILQGLSSNRLGEEQTVASQYASEGIEAVRSINNQSFSNLLNSTGTGIVRSGNNMWAFGGTNNQFGPGNKFTRVITVSDVYRDSNGNIVSSGGVLDPNTKKINCTVSWDFSPTRHNSVVSTTYLSNFKKPTVAIGGLLIYGDGTTIPKNRIYESSANKFSKEVSVIPPQPTLNPSITPMPIPLPGDSDGDKFKDTVENYVGTNPYMNCQPAANPSGVTTSNTAWPPDFNGDNKVNSSDTLTLNSHFNSQAGSSSVLFTPSQFLAADMNSAQTSLVASGTVIQNKQVLQVDNEQMKVTAGGGTTSLTVVRNYNGTTAATHLSNGSTNPIFSVAYDRRLDLNADGKINTSDILTMNPFFNTSCTYIPTGAKGKTFLIRTSPTKTEAIAGYVDSNGMLNVACYDGSVWSGEWSASVGGTGATKPFDIAYETASGKAMVMYSTNTPTTNELAYRTKLGSAGCGSANWTTATNFDPVKTTGVIQWVKMAWDRRSGNNLITAIWADANSALSAAVWNGAAWGNEPSSALETSLEAVSSSQDVDNFDVDYESNSGNVMVVWGTTVSSGNNGVRYARCTGGVANCTWILSQTPPNLADDALNLDISANTNPTSNEIIFASIGRAGHLQMGYWNGSSWTDKPSADNSTTIPFAGSKLVATGWLISGSTTRSIVAYDLSGATNINWFAGNGSSFSLQSPFNPTPPFGNPQDWYNIETNPQATYSLILTVSDNSNNLFAKQLYISGSPATFNWTNSDGGTSLETSLPQAINSPFSFAYWRNLLDQ